MSTINVAVIGGGPRGLWACEELLKRAERNQVPVHITVYEPGVLGAGSAYHPDQPVQWRINATSSIVRTHVGSFNQWRTDSNPEDQFPPRALVGEFLAYSWDQLLKVHPDTIEVVAAKVTAVTPSSDQGWRITAEGADSDFDEVLIATGHAPTWPGAHDGAVSAYPHTNLEKIPAGCHVAIRGASLTFIDVALYLAALPEDQQPGRVSVHCRSGRFMEAKPERLDVEVADSLARGDSRMRLVASFDEFREVLIDTACDVMRDAGSAPDRALVEAIVDGEDFTGDGVAELRRSVQGAHDAHWSVGVAWRGLYDAISWRTSFGGRSDLHGFHTVARRLERVGFGPPVVNAKKILELIDSGFVDVSQLTENVDSVGADVIVDAVLSPQGVVPGTLTADLIERGIANVPDNDDDGRGVITSREGFVAEGLAIVGRDTEDHVLGNDSLSRTLHDVIPRWAQAVVDRFAADIDIADRGVHATVPLTGRVEPWMVNLVGDADACVNIVEEFSSPTNVLNPAPMGRNIEELVNAGRDDGVTVKVFYARKANKGLCFVDEVRDSGHGVDVASERELRQVLDRGMDPDRIILSAAIKPDALLTLAIESGVPLSVDSTSEMRRIQRIATACGVTAKVAPRLAPDPTTMPPTRFGERLSVWQEALPEAGEGIAVVGAHAHMHGYHEKDRRFALGECLYLLDTAVDKGHHPEFVDLGGGVPMSYLDNGEEWDNYQKARTEMIEGMREPFTWKADPLNNTYPFHQSPTRGAWLTALLRGEVNDSMGAEGLISRGLRLHLEPGRSLLDGCGMILVDVAFVKQRADGLPLVGLAMNRTQCRTNTDDILLDPILIRTDRDTDPESAWQEPEDAFLVGAYCIEDELIIRRNMHFPGGIKAGDIIAIPNTAGYFMHILESASHQIPLAKNVVVAGAGRSADAGEATVRLDDIDA